MWRSVDLSQIPACNKSGFHCVVIVTNGSYSFTTISLGYYNNPSNMSAATAEYNAMNNVLAKETGSTFESRDTTTVDGLKAYRHYFTIPDSHNDEGNDYGMQIYFVKGQNIYELSVESVDQDVFQQRQSDIQQFIAAIKMK
jgi:hypothetical protein